MHGKGMKKNQDGREFGSRITTLAEDALHGEREEEITGELNHRKSIETSQQS